MCNLSWTPRSNLEKDNSLNHSCVSPKMGCLEYTNSQRQWTLLLPLTPYTANGLFCIVIVLICRDARRHREKDWPYEHCLITECSVLVYCALNVHVASYCWSLFGVNESVFPISLNGVVAASETNTRLYRTVSTNQSQIQDFPKEGAPFVRSARSTRFSGGGG